MFSVFMFSCGTDEEPVEADVLGCTDPNSINYNPDANKDDGSCKVIPEKNTPLLTLWTSTEDWSCGQYGIPTINQLESENADVVFLTCHGSGSDFHNSLGATFADKVLNIRRVPRIYVNDQGLWHLDTERNVEDVYKYMKEVEEQPVMAGIYGEYELPFAARATCSLWVKFFQPYNQKESGELRMAVYLLEDGLIARQAASRAEEIPHSHLIIEPATAGLGTLLKPDAFATGDVIELEYKRTIEVVKNTDNMKVIAVLLKYANGIEIVNSAYLNFVSN